MPKLKFFLSFSLLLMIFISSAYSYQPQFVSSEKTNKLSWKGKKIPISLSSSLFRKNNIKAQSDILAAIKRSLTSWEKVASIEFEISFSFKNNVSKTGTAGDGVSLITVAPTVDNLLLFDEKLENASAITRLFYNAKGDIKEADIVLNPIQLFSSDGTFGSFDLEATLTHEIGHFLGLGHSNILGSTMHSHQGKNGIYNLAGFSSRTLTEDDKAGAISLYGKNTSDTNCCVTLSGNLTNQTKKSSKIIQVWIEDVESGRIIAGTETNEQGNYLIEGIPKLNYKVYAQNTDISYSTKFVGEADMNSKSNFTINKNLIFTTNDFNLKYIGYNGQLANLAVPVVAGKTHTIYIAGDNLDTNNFNVDFHSNNFEIIKDSLLQHNYGIGVSVFSFEIVVANETPNGEYSFYLKKNNGNTEHFIGGITVESSSE